jgi:hypothetical protein
MTVKLWRESRTDILLNVARARLGLDKVAKCDDAQSSLNRTRRPQGVPCDCHAAESVPLWRIDYFLVDTEHSTTLGIMPGCSHRIRP